MTAYHVLTLGVNWLIYRIFASINNSDMTSKTSGLVLRAVKHSDKSSIVTVYTRDYGRISYIIYGAGRKKSTVKPACFLPLSIIEISATHHPGKDIQQLKEARIEHNLSGTFTSPVKNAITLYIAELLFKTLKHPDPEPHIFDFLKEAVLTLNQNEAGIANFHLIFSMQLCRYLGIEPNGEYATSAYFDLMNGVFVKNKPLHSHFLNTEATKSFANLLNLSFDEMHTLNLSRNKRNELLEYLLEYYKLHIPDFHGLNSTAVLHEVFS